MRISGIQIAEGEMAPWWYGAAYYSAYDDFLVCYPVPINIIVRWAREIGWRLRRGKADAISTAYKRGKRHGRRLVDKRERDAADAILRMAKKSIQ